MDYMAQNVPRAALPVQRLQEKAARTAAAFQERLTELPLAMPQMCAALHLLEAGGIWSSYSPLWVLWTQRVVDAENAREVDTKRVAMLAPALQKSKHGHGAAKLFACNCLSRAVVVCRPYAPGHHRRQSRRSRHGGAHGRSAHFVCARQGHHAY